MACRWGRPFAARITRTVVGRGNVLIVHDWGVSTGFDEGGAISALDIGESSSIVLNGVTKTLTTYLRVGQVG